MDVETHLFVEDNGHPRGHAMDFHDCSRESRILDTLPQQALRKRTVVPAFRMVPGSKRGPAERPEADLEDPMQLVFQRVSVRAYQARALCRR